jgi:membrane fusion protein (multidrug efflux system)
VSLNVDLGQRNDVFAIPQQAIARDTAGPYAMVVGQNGKVIRKAVDADDSYAQDWIVTKGLSPGDRVIVSGMQGVHEGLLVSATPAAAPNEGTRLSQAGAAHPSSSPLAGNRS